MTSPWTAVASRVLFPLHERLKHHDTVTRFRGLEASQWHSPLEIEELRDAKLRAFVTDIAANVPHYRELFAERGASAARVRTAADLTTLPFLTKPLIRAGHDALVSARAGKLKKYNTGGSSGEPLTFCIGPGRASHDVAAKWRATRWWGVDVGDPEVVVWGSPIEVSSQDRLRQLRDRMFRSTLLPAFEMSPANLSRFVTSIRAIKPRMVFGYPSALALIAEHAAAEGKRLDDLGVRVVFVTAERLYDHQRAAIAAAFDAPVANGYGARDAGFIAHECPHGGMHISAEDVIVEIVDAEGRAVPAGTPGEVVVTHLATGDFPFVRYRTGDVAALDTTPCACGRGLPKLAQIHGRTTDFVVAEDGTVMHGLALIYPIRELAGIAKFKIIQHDRRRTEVLLVTGPGFVGGCERKIVADFKARLGEDVDVVVKTVDAIAAEASGKFRYVVSHAQPASQNLEPAELPGA